MKRIFIAMVLMFTISFITSCRDQKAKDKVENVAEDVEDATEEVAEEVENTAEDVANEVEDAVD